MDHEFPEANTVEGGRPTVGKRASVIGDTGFDAAGGVRQMLGGATQIEARFEVRTIHDFTETAIAFAGRSSLMDSLSLGFYVSYGETTKRHVSATAKVSAALRLRF